MRNVIVTNITTLDGFYSGADGNPMVLNVDAAFDAYNLERMHAASTVLLGRRSFEMFSSYGPMVADAPSDAADHGLSEPIVSSAGCTRTSREDCRQRQPCRRR